MVWQIAGMGLQAYGQYSQGEAAKRDNARQQALAQNYQNAYNVYAQRQNAGQQSLLDRQHALTMQGYDGYSQLGSDLGNSPAAGDAAGTANDARLQSALTMVPAAPVRANIGNTAPAADWSANTDAQRYAPVMQARNSLMRQNAVNTGAALSDRNALGQNATSQVVTGREAMEAQQREMVLEAKRRQLLEQAGIENRYTGPDTGFYNAQLLGQGLNLAGSAAMGYGQYQQGQNPGYSNSPYASNRPYGPAR